jgi:hypothetical protein
MRTLFCTIIGLAALVLCGWTMFSVHAERPEIQVEPGNVNFGVVFAGATVEHSVNVTNQSSAPIRIEKITSSCGCTVVDDLSMTEVAPGDSIHIKLRVNTSELKGSVTQYVAILFNTGQIQQVTLQGIVEPGLPKVVDVGKVLAGQSVCWEGPVSSKRYTTDITADLAVDGKIIWAEYAGDGGEDARLVLAVCSTAEPGAFVNHVNLTRRDRTTQKVTVKGYVMNRVEVSPREVFLEHALTAAASSPVITIHAPYGDNLEHVNVDLYEGNTLAWSEVSESQDRVHLKLAPIESDPHHESADTLSTLRITTLVGGWEYVHFVDVTAHKPR